MGLIYFLEVSLKIQVMYLPCKWQVLTKSFLLQAKYVLNDRLLNPLTTYCLLDVMYFFRYWSINV
jgi:hypothetical protein